MLEGGAALQPFTAPIAQGVFVVALLRRALIAANLRITARAILSMASASGVGQTPQHCS